MINTGVTHISLDSLNTQKYNQVESQKQIAPSTQGISSTATERAQLPPGIVDMLDHIVAQVKMKYASDILLCL
jgi:hypothetical protein